MSTFQFLVSSVPTTLCISNPSHRFETLSFFREIETKLYAENVRIHIDLSGVKQFTAEASLFFFATISNAKLRLNDPKVVQFTWPQKVNNPQGHKAIIATGLAAALLANSVSDLDQLTIDERFFQSSVDPEKQLISTRAFLLKNMDKPLNENQFGLLTAAIGEAMINVKHHAYELDQSLELKSYLGGSRWWQCSWYHPDWDALFFIICDLGCGVIDSYKSSHSDISTHKTEPDILREAFSEGFSRFIDQGRGNGSEDIKRPITEGQGMNDVKYEKLRVFSGYSQYEYTIQNGKPIIKCNTVSSIISNDLSKASSLLPGTIIEWCLIPERTKLTIE